MVVTDAQGHATRDLFVLLRKLKLCGQKNESNLYLSRKLGLGNGQYSMGVW